jgi:hypothetical protein
MTTLADQLAALPGDIQKTLADCGFDASRLIRLADPLRQGVTADNLVKGHITPPGPGDVVQLPEPGSAE